MWKFVLYAFLLSQPMLLSRVARADEADLDRRIDQIQCGRLTHATVANYRYEFGIDKGQWGKIQIQELYKRINECFPYEVSSSGDTIANELLHMDKSDAAEIDAARERARSAAQTATPTPEQSHPNAGRVSSEVKVIPPNPQALANNPKCTGWTNTLRCDKTCNFFFRLNAHEMNMDFLKPYSGKELDQWTESDFSRLRNDYTSCDVGDQGRFVYGVPPTYIERVIDVLHDAWHKALASAQSMSSLPSECRVALSAVTDKDGQLANRLARLQNETNNLFNAGDDQQACSKLQDFSENMQSVNDTLLQCRTSNDRNSDTSLSSDMFTRSAGVANQLKALAIRFGQQKGC